MTQILKLSGSLAVRTASERLGAGHEWTMFFGDETVPSIAVRMKHESHWQPTKYRNESGISPVGPTVGPASRLAAALVARAYRTYIPQYAAGSLGDFGCGEVPLYGIYREHVEEIVCVDWPSSKHELNHLDVACDMSQPLPFRNGSFETVVLSDVLEHIAEPTALWKEIGRVVAPGGHVLMNVPFLYWLHEEPYDYYRYTAHALRHLAETNGFTVERLEPLGGSIEVGIDLIGKHLGVVPVVGKWLARVIQAVGIWWSRTVLGQSAIRVSGKRFPLAYFMVARRRG